MKSNSRVLRGWRDFGVKATAIILTILLATQMVGTPAFASGALTNKQASEDIAATVDDTGVEPSGTEATDTTVPDEAAGAANEPAPADSTQATEEPVVETVESATEPATETPAADPAANTVLGTEPEPAPAPAVEQDQLASIKLDLADSASITLSKDGNKIDDDTNPVDVPANEELKFTAQAAEGWQVDKVKTVIDGVETEPTADANGEYKVAADKVTDKLTVKVEAKVVEADETVAGTSNLAVGNGEKLTIEDKASAEVANTASSSGVVGLADNQNEAVTVTVKKTDNDSYSAQVQLPLGNIDSEVVASAVADLDELSGYEYRDARVDNVAVIAINKYGETYYVSTGEDQIAGIALDSTTEVVLFFQPEGSTYQVDYKVMLGGQEVSGDAVPGSLIGPETVNKGESLRFSFTPYHGYEIRNATASDNIQVRDESAGVYQIDAVNDANGDKVVTITISVQEISTYSVAFTKSSNTRFEFNGSSFTSNKGGTTTKQYNVARSISFKVTGFNEWNSPEEEKDFNKLVISFDGVSHSIAIPMGRNTKEITQLEDLGYTVTVERTSEYGTTYPSFTVTIEAPNGKVRGDIAIETNFKDRSNSEVWANVLVGVESLRTNNNTSSDAGDGSLTASADGIQKYAVRDTGRESTITITVADGYDKAATPQLTVVIDGQEVSNAANLFDLKKSTNQEGVWTFKLPSDSGFDRFDFEDPKDIRISVTVPSLEHNYGAKFEGEGYSAQTKDGSWSAGENFAVSDNSGSVPTREGYVFQGWKLKGDPNGTVYKNGFPFAIGEDTLKYAERDKNGVYYFTFVAQWIDTNDADEVPYNINLYFADESGDYGDDPSETIQEDGVPNKNAFIDAESLTQTLIGLGYIDPNEADSWIADDTKNKYSVFITADGTASIDIYYQRAITITFNPGDGAVDGTQSVKVKIPKNSSLEESDIPSFPAKDGYSFSHWKWEGQSGEWTNDELLAKDGSPRTFKEDADFTAQWNEAEDLFGYHMTLPTADFPGGYLEGYEDNGTGSGGAKKYKSTEKYAKGESVTVTIIKPVDSSGYLFVGWFGKDAGTDNWVEAAMYQPGDTVTYPWGTENKNVQVYTLDAIFASVEATPVEKTYDGKCYGIENVEADVTYDNLAEKYQKQIEALGVSVTEIQYSEDGGKTWQNESPKYKDAGNYPIKVKATVKVGDVSGEVTTDTYVKINKRDVTVTADSAEKDFDGTALTASGWKVSDPTEGSEGVPPT
ncbi:MAG TPA: InlB B-repeat-containing protein, partial [Candidatus Aphodovivens avicola]|nr:InlB B-repeat-containing protein [Candidatus Aphodovivens avicola]